MGRSLPKALSRNFRLPIFAACSNHSYLFNLQDHRRIFTTRTQRIHQAHTGVQYP